MSPEIVIFSVLLTQNYFTKQKLLFSQTSVSGKVLLCVGINFTTIDKTLQDLNLNLQSFFCFILYKSVFFYYMTENSKLD